MISNLLFVLSLGTQMLATNYALNGCEEFMGAFDGTAIVQVTNIESGGNREQTGFRGEATSVPVVLVRVTVRSGLQGVSGQRTLVETGYLERSMFNGAIGANFIVLATRPDAGKLRIPTQHYLGHGPYDTPPGWQDTSLDQQQSNELYVSLAWKTNKLQLAVGDRPYKKIVRSIAEAAVGGDDLTRKNVATFFENTGMENMGSTDDSTTSRPESDPVVTSLRSLLPICALSERARWISLLHKWKVPNAEMQLWETLIAACDLQEGEFAVPYIAYQIRRETILAGCTTPEEKQSRWNSVLETALRSRFDDLFVTVFRPCPKPNTKKLRQVFTKIVAMQDQDSCEMAFFRLANWHKDTVHSPRRENVNGRDTWVNRGELITYWRTFLGAP